MSSRPWARALVPSPLLGVLGLYAACSIAVLGLAQVAMLRLGLPDWVVPSTLVLLLIGLPIIVTTALLQHGRMPVRERAPRASDLRPLHWLTWRRALSGGGFGFAGLGLATAGYMALRALGIGPVGTLLAAGVLKDRERLIVADFSNHTRDTTLSGVLTNAFRIDLAQSPAVTVMPNNQVVEALARDEAAGYVAARSALAREVAVREGVKAVVVGEIASAGSGYVLSAQLVIAPRAKCWPRVARRLATQAGSSQPLIRLSRKLRRTHRRVLEGNSSRSPARAGHHRVSRGTPEVRSGGTRRRP